MVKMDGWKNLASLNLMKNNNLYLRILITFFALKSAAQVDTTEVMTSYTVKMDTVFSSELLESAEFKNVQKAMIELVLYQKGNPVKLDDDQRGLSEFEKDSILDARSVISQTSPAWSRFEPKMIALVKKFWHELDSDWRKMELMQLLKYRAERSISK